MCGPLDMLNDKEMDRVCKDRGAQKTKKNKSANIKRTERQKSKGARSMLLSFELQHFLNFYRSVLFLVMPVGFGNMTIHLSH
jgi:hypothetical protein